MKRALNIINNPVIWKDYIDQFVVQSEAIMRCVAETKSAKFMISVYVSRNANESSKASLHKSVVVNLPDVVKPEM